MPGSNSLAVHVTADTKQLNAGLAAAEARVQAFGATVNKAAASEAARAGDQSLISQAQTTAQAWVASRQAMIASEERANAVLKAGRKANAASVAATLDELDARHDAFLAASRRYYESLTTAQQEAYAAQETAANKSIESEYQRLSARLDDAAAVDADTAALDRNTVALTFNAQAQREASYAVGEAATGRYGRLETSLFSLGARTGLMAKLMTPAGLAVGSVAAGAAVLTAALVEGERAMGQYDRALLSTGNAAGLTAEDLDAMSVRIASSDGTIGQARQALVALAQSGRFTGDTLKGAAQAAVDFAAVTGQNMKQAASAVEDLATKPVSAIERLDAQYHFLTLAQLEEIQRLEREGQAYQASEVAMQAFANAFHQRAAQVVADEGWLVRVGHEVERQFSQMWHTLEHPMGGPSGLPMLKERLAWLQKNDQTYGSTASDQAEIARLQTEIRIAEQKQKTNAEQAQITEKGKQAEEYLSKQIAGLKTVNVALEHEKALTAQIEALHRANPSDALLKGDVFSSSGKLLHGNSDYQAIIAKFQKEFDSHPVQLSFSADKAVGNDTYALAEREIREASQALNAINQATEQAAQQRLAIAERLGSEKQAIAEREIRDASQTLNAINATEQRAARQREQVWQQSLRTVEGAENQFLSGYLSGRLNLASAERELVQRLAISEIEATAHAVTEKLMLQASGVAKGKSISILAGQEEIMRDAAQAAAGAFKAVVGIPYVGPILAPIAAATAFTAVEAYKNLASFDVGTSFVPSTGLAMVHRSEMILPPPQANVMRSVMRGEGGSGGAGTFNLHVHAPDGDSVQRLFLENGHLIASAIQRQLRNGWRP